MRTSNKTVHSIARLAFLSLTLGSSAFAADVAETTMANSERNARDVIADIPPRGNTGESSGPSILLSAERAAQNAIRTSESASSEPGSLALTINEERPATLLDNELSAKRAIADDARLTPLRVFRAASSDAAPIRISTAAQ